MQYERPGSLAEALAVLDTFGAEAKVLAGGTAGVLMLREGLIAPNVLVDIARIPGLSGIEKRADGLHIGPLTRLHDVAASALVRAAYPALAEACASVGNVRIRNQATLGGNLAEADYASDPPAVLLALEAEVEATSPAGPRRIALTEFFLGFFQTALEPTELITDIRIPPHPGPVRTAYRKFQSRAWHDRPCVGVAAVARFDGPVCAALRVAVGAACATPRRLPAVEALGQGQPWTGPLMAAIAAGYAAGIETLDDVRGSAWYRSQMVGVHVRQALERVQYGGG